METTQATHTKKSNVKPVPEGFHTVTPFIIAKGAKDLIDFMIKAFDGKQTYMQKDDKGLVMHATVQIGNSTIMISDEMEKFPAMPGALYLYVEDVDAVYQKALDAGATSVREPVDEFYGDRSCGVRDKWNNQWWIATHIEDVSEEESQNVHKRLTNSKHSSISGVHKVRRFL